MMVDKREGKGEYIQWRPEESKLLIELVADCFKKGWVDPHGRMFKKTVESKILSVLNGKFSCRKTYKHYINRMKILKNQYRDFVNLLHFDSKFEWDPITKKFTAPDEVWNDYFKEFPNQRHMRYETYEDYENMKLVFGKNMAMRRRLDRSHSQALEVGKNEKPKQEVDLTNDDDDDKEVHESMEEGTSLDLENFVGSPLPDQGDRSDDDAFDDSSDDPSSVTEKDVLVKIFTELRSINDSFSKQMLPIMQGRSMVDDESKKMNVWDAIKEIPNLSNNVRYKALTMIQKLEMRDVFFDMSVEDRLGWIQCNTQ